MYLANHRRSTSATPARRQLSRRAARILRSAALIALVWAALPGMRDTQLAAQGGRVPAANRVPPDARRVVRQAYELGYHEGLQRGERDSRDRRQFDYERDDWYRDGDRGYRGAYGARDAYRADYRRGFAAGYREGYARVRIAVPRGRGGRVGAPPLRGYSDPAAARGYSDGYAHGFEDGEDRDRYDPARHGDYRDADEGYKRDYGAKDVYKGQLPGRIPSGLRRGVPDRRPPISGLRGAPTSGYPACPERTRRGLHGRQPHGRGPAALAAGAARFVT